MIMLYAVVTRIYNIKLITEERDGFIKFLKKSIPEYENEPLIVFM